MHNSSDDSKKQSKLHDYEIGVTLLSAMSTRSLTVHRKCELSVSGRGRGVRFPLSGSGGQYPANVEEILKFKRILLHFPGILEADIKYKNRIHISLSKNLYIFL